MAVRLFLFGGGILGEAGGYGRLVVMGPYYSSYGPYISYMSYGSYMFHKTYNPHNPHKAFRLFKPLLKTETAIRDLGWLFALVCYEKFERTLKLHSFGCCFTKHDLYRESIEIIFFRCLGPCLSGFVFALSGLYLMTVVALSTGDVVSMVRCCSVSMVAESV